MKTPGSSGGSDGSALSDFLDPTADSLWEKVDFRGMVGSFGRSTVLAFFTGASGVVLAVQRNMVELASAWEDAIRDVAVVVTTTPGQLYTGVFRNAEAELAQFDLFAVPIAILVLLSVLATITFVLDLFLGGDD